MGTAYNSARGSGAGPGARNQCSGSKENNVLFDPSSIIQGILGFYGNLWSLVQQLLTNIFGGLIPH